MSRVIIATTSDGQHIAEGDVMEFTASDQFVNAATVNVPSAALVGTAHDTDAPARIKIPSPAGRNVDCLAIAKGVVAAKVQGVAAECSGSRVASAVSVAGDKIALRSISQVGSGRVLTIVGASKLEAFGISNVSGSCAEYGIFGSFPESPNTDCHLYGVDIRVTDKTPITKVHAIRYGHGTRFTLGDKFYSLPDGPGKGFACYFEHDSRRTHTDSNGNVVTDPGVGASYGSAGNFKQLTDAMFYRDLFVGSVGIMAGLDADEPNHPDWRTSNTIIDGCEFRVINYLSFGHGTIGTKVSNTVIKAIDRIRSQTIRGSCCEFKGPLGAWPASSGTFTNVKFYGDAICDKSNIPNMRANWKFIGCTLNGKPI